MTLTTLAIAAVLWTDPRFLPAPNMQAGKVTMVVGKHDPRFAQDAGKCFRVWDQKGIWIDPRFHQNLEAYPNRNPSAGGST